MTVTATRYEHIVLDEHGIPLIAGTTMKVIELALAQRAYGWGAEDLRSQHPYLTLGQVYSALAYYSDHQDNLDRDLAARQHAADDLRRTLPVPVAIARLKHERGR